MDEPLPVFHRQDNCRDTRGIFGADAFEKAKRTLIELLDATVVVRSTAKDGSGRTQYVAVPDNGIRLAAAVKLIELEAGKAPQAIDLRADAGQAGAMSARDVVRQVYANPVLAMRIFEQSLAAAHQATSAAYPLSALVEN